MLEKKNTRHRLARTQPIPGLALLCRFKTSNFNKLIQGKVTASVTGNHFNPSNTLIFVRIKVGRETCIPIMVVFWKFGPRVWEGK